MSENEELAKVWGGNNIACYIKKMEPKIEAVEELCAFEVCAFEVNDICLKI